MPVYASCGILGFFPREATKKDFEEANYQPSQFVTSCGFLGFFPQKATLADVPPTLKSDCTPAARSAAHGFYEVTAPGECTLKSCDGGFIRVKGGTQCVAPHTPCVPTTAYPHAHYTYSTTGECLASSCSVGTVMRPEFTAARTQTTSCPRGYRPVTSAQACAAAASAFQITAHNPFSITEPAVMDGCVVYNDGDAGGSASAAYNANPNGSGFVSNDQFLLCERAPASPCVKQGTGCLPGHANYTWSHDGMCAGECSHESCAPDDKCCPTSNTCVAEAVTCPMARSLDTEAKSIAHTIRSMTSTADTLSSAFHNIHV